MKRILLISSNSSSRGGGERYLSYLTQGLHQLDCEVHILLSSKSYMDYWANEFSIEGAKIHRKPLLGLRHRPLRFLQSILDKEQQLKVAETCQEIAPDAILVNQQYDEDGLDYLAGALMSKVAPVAGIIHMPMTATKNQRPLGKLRGKLLQKWYQKHPYSLIFVSQGSQAEFSNYYNILHPKTVINNGCFFPEIALPEPNLPKSWNKSLPVIGFSGQFVPQKNLQLLIDAWLWMREQGIETRLLLVGDGSLRYSIEKRLSDNAPHDSWYITGWQENPQTYLSQIDIYVMTSHFEGLPLALLEAAGNGIPCLVTNFNGASDIAKHAPWVKVVTSYNPESVGSAIFSSLKNLSNLKQQAKDKQLNFRNYFSTQRMAQETLTVFKTAA